MLSFVGIKGSYSDEVKVLSKLDPEVSPDVQQTEAQAPAWCSTDLRKEG